MFDSVLNIYLDYLSCFAVVIRVIHRKVDICQTYYSNHSKLRIFPYSEVIHEITVGTTFKLAEGQEKLKKNDQLLNLMFVLYVIFFAAMS